MRERLAKVLAALVTGLVVLMAAYFAHRRNPSATSSRGPTIEIPSTTTPGAGGDTLVPMASPTSDPALVARGRTVFEERACTRCHAAEGRGNPRLPLDGVGSRRTATELRAFVTGAGVAREQLTRSALRAKEEFANLPSTELDALTAYLTALR
jgi:cytochrome c553